MHTSAEREARACRTGVRQAVGVILGLLLALSLVVMAAGCGSSSPSPETGAGGAKELPPLRLGVIPVEDNFPFFVAEAEGLFAKNGLKVELLSFNSARDRDTALQAGEIDGEVADIVAAALIRKGGTPVKIVSLTMGLTPAEGRFALLTAPGSGIDRPADLKGVPVAVSQHTIIDYVAYRLLTGAGLKPEEIKTTNVPAIPERLQLLLGGAVQAALLPDPMATLAEKRGAKVLLDDTQGKDNVSQVVLLFREETIAANGEAIARLLDVFAQAAARVSENPNAYRELFIAKARVPEDLKDTYLAPKYSPPALPRPEEVQAVMDWMVAGGLLEQPYTYEDLVDPAFMSGKKS
ncbi:MAG: metal ABC transporter substrate-binding protein [Clostridia bacterium]|nr:MAG: metal ABC transporter substrate-binding protein [Clostridia bacterium]